MSPLRIGWLVVVFGNAGAVLGFVQLAAAARADRYVYFPHIGLFLLIAGLPAWSSSFFVQFRKTIISAIVVLFAVATYQQSLIWSNSVSLWTACVKVDPDNHRGHDLLAQAYLREEKVEEAIQQARIAFLYAENSESLDAFMTLGSALLIQGDTAGAIENLREAIRIRPSNPAALINLGYALHETDLAESTKLFETARELEPRNTEAIGNLANCEAEAGNLQRAIELLREAIRISPKDERLRQNLKTFEAALRDSRR